MIQTRINRTPRARSSAVLFTALLALGGVSHASAANVTLLSNDVSNTSSFNAYVGDGSTTGWSDFSAPGASNDYFTGAFVLRTPSTAGSYSFLGNSLTVQTGGQLAIKTPTAATITVPNLIVDGGTITESASSGNGTFTYELAGGLTVNTSAIIKVSSPATNSFHMLNITAAISGSGVINIADDGATIATRGATQLSAANTFSGTINVLSNPRSSTLGALRLNNFDAVKFAAVNVESVHATNPGLTFSAGAGTYNIGSLSGAVSTGRVLTSSGVVMSVGANNTSTSFAGVVAGAGSLAKVGTGTLSLSGANTYTGGTVVNQGAVSFGSAFTMSGANGASITAGGPFGQIVANNNTLTFGGTLDLAFDGAASGVQVYDLFSTSGSGALAGSFAGVSISGSYIGALTDPLATGIWSGSIDGVNFSFSQITGDLTVSAVPEPSAFAALAGLVGLGFAASRRRRSA